MTTTGFPNDILLANLVHSCIADLSESDANTAKPSVRYGDRKCFISAVWRKLTETCAYALPDLQLLSLSDFKTWVVEAMRLCDTKGLPLILLARADLVGAMDRDAVRQSEVSDRGADFHFIIDRNAGADEYLALKS